MLSRREMLKESVLLSLAPVVPTFLARTALAAGQKSDGRVLVVIQLDGGNDGLNTVIPYRDENYARLRPKLAIKPDNVIKMGDEIGLHPAMKAAGSLFDDGRFAVVQGVGYPNPDRSHFRSMAIWQSARLDNAEHGQYGWLGRALDQSRAGDGGPDAVFVGSGAVPVTLWGRRSTVASMQSADELSLAASADALRAASAVGVDGELAQLARRSADEAFTTAQRLATFVQPGDRSRDGAYSDSALAQQLRLISAMIKSGTPASVLYTAQSGYDTHAAQANEHYQLLRVFAGALAAFLDDLAASGLSDRVLVLAFSEFGRRAAENDSAGTDHGAASPVFVAGPKLAAGIFGPTPNLADLQDGDVRMAIDFRQVYAAVLERWLNVPSEPILGGHFAPLELLKPTTA
ncbi:MAG: DUF1501 domain-containing protein [Planctomycetia bacterium]|nr:DUF1501 domain-containing protein [Planctomycetia bacterium]